MNLSFFWPVFCSKNWSFAPLGSSCVVPLQPSFAETISSSSAAPRSPLGAAPCQAYPSAHGKGQTCLLFLGVPATEPSVLYSGQYKESSQLLIAQLHLLARHNRRNIYSKLCPTVLPSVTVVNNEFFVLPKRYAFNNLPIIADNKCGHLAFY